MRIGILTLPLHTNYGGILQAYALQTVLERMGHEVCLLEQRKPLNLPIWKMPLSYSKRLLKNLSGHPCPIFREQKIKREQPVIRQNTDKFINKYIKRKFVNKFSEINNSDYDAFVVGSDQIWRPILFSSKIKNAYLSFAENWTVKRISYAASFGTDEWEYTPQQTKECGRLLKLFDAVSIREDSGAQLCRKRFGIDATHVLDPTMLLNTTDYINLFKNANTRSSSGTLFSHILDITQEKMDFVNKMAQQYELIPFSLNSKAEDIAAPLNERIQPPVEQWLRGFYDAKLVVTDSFHACVFSILFNKPFFVIGNANRGMSRFTSLLNTFKLSNRLTNCNTPIFGESIINWEHINAIRDNKAKLSIKFLIDNLK